MLDRSSQTPPTATGLTVALVLAAVALGACGGAGKGATGNAATTRSASSAGATATAHAATSPKARAAHPAPGSKAFIARADTICRRLNEQLTATAPHQGESNAAVARNAMQHAALERRTAAELSRLTPPGELTRDWRRIVAYRRVLAADLVTLAHLLESGRSSQASGLLAAKSAAHAVMSATAAHAGFSDCAKVGTAS